MVRRELGDHASATPAIAWIGYQSQRWMYMERERERQTSRGRGHVRGRDRASERGRERKSEIVQRWPMWTTWLKTERERKRDREIDEMTLNRDGAE